MSHLIMYKLSVKCVFKTSHYVKVKVIKSNFTIINYSNEDSIESF